MITIPYLNGSKIILNTNHAVVFTGLVYAVFVGGVTFRTELAANSDGATLLAAANSLASGYGVLDFDGRPMTYWPPGFPAVVAGLHVLGLNLNSAAWVINVGSAFVIMASAAFWLFRVLENHKLAWLGIASCAVLHPMLDVLAEVRSDPLFLALCLVSLNCAMLWMMGYRKLFYWGMVFSVLACLTRYHGVALLATWALFVVVDGRSRTLSDSVRLMGWVIAAGLPTTAWLIRNLVVSGTLTGPRPLLEDSAGYLAEMLPRTTNTVTNWFFPESIPIGMRIALFVLGLVLLSFCLVWIGTRRTSSPVWKKGVFVMAVFLVIYVAITLFTSITTAAWGVPRYLAIMAPVLVLLILAAADGLGPLLPGKAGASILILAPAFFLLPVPMARSAHLVSRIQEGKPGYQYGSWYAELGPAVRSFSFDGYVLSSAPGFVWTNTRVQENSIKKTLLTRWLAKGPDEARRRILDIAMNATPLTDPSWKTLYFVDVRQGPEQDWVSLEDMRRLFTLTPILKVRDGGIWRLVLPLDEPAE